MLGAPVLLSHLNDHRLLLRLRDASTVIFHRVPMDRYVERIFAQVQRQGALPVLDLDDLLYDPQVFQWIDSPDFADPVRAAQYQAEMARHRATLDACAAVTVSTDYLARQVRALGKPVWVHRNAFSSEMAAYSADAVRRVPAHPNRIVIGYASGTPTHDRDFMLVKPALMEIMRKHSQVHLLLVGSLHPGRDWGSLADRLHRIPLVAWRQLPWLMAQFDINLAPLVEDNPFSQSKSEIKYVEAGLVHVPTIASPTDAFTSAIRPGETGLLASSGEQWYAALENLVSRVEERKRMGEAAYAHVWDACHPVTRAYELLDTLNEIRHANRRETLQIPEGTSPSRDPMDWQRIWIPPEMDGFPSLVERGVYSLRHRGWKTLAGQVWIYLRRLVSPLFPFRNPHPPSRLAE